MRYTIEISETGEYLIKYHTNNNSEAETEITLEIFSVWPTGLITEVSPDVIEDIFGTDIEDFKKRIGKGVYNAGFTMEEWIRVHISNIM